MNVCVVQATSRLPLIVGSAATFVAAVSLDLIAAEHPTHTVSLALVTLVVAALRLRLAGRHDDVFSVVAGAVVAQPALHATSKLGGHGPASGADGLMHVAAADGPITLMHIVVSAVIVIAVATCTRFTQLLITVLRRPVKLLTAEPPTEPKNATVGAHPLRLGSMLRWCGWIIRAARRGPPAGSTADSSSRRLPS